MDDRERRRYVTDLILTLTGLAWVAATPYLLFGAMITAAPFFGETPSADERQRAATLLVAGLACGLLLPVLGMVVAGVTGRRGVAWGFAAALALTVGALGFYASR